jgi:polyadenylate-binding protein
MVDVFVFAFQMGYPQPAGGYFMPAMPQPQRFFQPAQAAMRGAQPRWMQQPRGQVQAQAMMGMGSQFRGQRPVMQRVAHPGAMVGGMARGPMAMTAAGQPMQMPMMQARPGMPPQAMAMQQVGGARMQSFKYAPGVRNPAQVVAMPQGMPVQQQSAVLIQGQEPLTASMLAAAPPQEQKQMLGERLFPLIQRMYPELAGKITGMLLEIDNSELLHMLEHHESLMSKVSDT